jgi:hypothetical protein
MDLPLPEENFNSFNSNMSFEIKNTNDFFDPSKSMGLENSIERNPFESRTSSVEENPFESSALSVEENPFESSALSVKGNPFELSASFVEGNPFKSSASSVKEIELSDDFNFFKGIDWDSPLKSGSLSVERKSSSKSGSLSVERKSSSESGSSSVERKSSSESGFPSVKEDDLSIRRRLLKACSSSVGQKLLKKIQKRTLEDDLKNFKDLADIVHQNMVEANQQRKEQKEQKFKRFRDEVFEAIFSEGSL